MRMIKGVDIWECDKTKFSYEKKTIIGRLYKATLTDEELEEVKRKIEEALK